MPDVKLGQTWERRSIPGAPWRPVRVENLPRDNVELRYLDLPGAPELEQLFSGSRARFRQPGKLDGERPDQVTRETRFCCSASFVARGEAGNCSTVAC
jgi:hypothetical protein